MPHAQQIWAAVLFYGAAQGIFISNALFFARRGRQLANRYLALLVLAVTATVLTWFLVATDLIGHFPLIAYGPYIADSAIGPLFYFYTRTLLEPEYRPKTAVLAAAVLLPAIARLLYLGVLGMDVTGIIVMYENLFNGQYPAVRPASIIGTTLVTSYCLVFGVLALRHMMRFEKWYRREYPGEISVHIRWLKLLSVFLFLYAFALVSIVLTLVFTLHWYMWLEYAESVVRALIIQIIAVSVFILPGAYLCDAREYSSRRRRPIIDDTTAVRYLARLQAHMVSARPYRDVDLRLGDLAESVGLPAHALSLLLNEHLQTNFADFVNQYRVDDIRELLRHEESDRYTLVALAKQAGFSSKTSFYRAFRKHSGMSPSEFRFMQRHSGRAEAN